MSKLMQLTVRVRAYYPKAFKDAYPKIAGHLRRVDESLVEQDPSLFELVGRLDKLLYALDGNPDFKAILLKHKDALVSYHKQIESHIADWKLAEADKLLYELEDCFDEIEGEADSA